MLIRISPSLEIDDSELEEIFAPASGPGGQNVNKVSSAVQLRFNFAANTTLPEPVKARLVSLAGRRLSQNGILIIEAEKFRSQLRNREDARERLFELIRAAGVAPKIPQADAADESLQNTAAGSEERARADEEAKRKSGRKLSGSFSEEKEPKRLCSASRLCGFDRANAHAKKLKKAFFWFFFSKKNRFLSVL